MAVAPSPWLGSGYESFWPSQVGLGMRDRWLVFQAHNGYVEMYLNLGLVGLSLILASMVAGLYKIWRDLPDDVHAASLRLDSGILVRARFAREIRRVPRRCQNL